MPKFHFEIVDGYSLDDPYGMRYRPSGRAKKSPRKSPGKSPPMQKIRS